MMIWLTPPIVAIKKRLYFPELYCIIHVPVKKKSSVDNEHSN